MLKYQNYIYVNLRSAEVHKFRGQFHNIPEALEYASKKFIEEADNLTDKPSLRGFMVLLEASGLPAYPVGYKHPKIPDIAVSRLVDITTAQRYLHSYRQKPISKAIDILLGDKDE